MRIFDQPKSAFIPRIRIINLVDVLFILLIFFIATSTFRVASQQAAAVKLSLPEAKSAEEVGKEKTNQLKITVAPDGTVFLGENKIAVGDLEKALEEAKKKNPNIILELSADKSASYGTVVSIVDAARLSGIQNITAFTKKSVNSPLP